MFYEITNVECVYLSNTTIQYMYFLHKVLHVSALDNGNLQVLHEILIKH